ncbi:MULTISPECIES: hypothetical protein [Chryseobacterium]|jgi:hypothetical protein|uniref:Uncharacterized protein YhhL (DUF1145 family) n=1 Tax=Chryseobacterium geocarposphaerae TaxID=1416776 RepID=A0ABU1LH33_9FLAO|nr:MULTISPECIES: hypothetical protein [Chryseobacterium]ALR29206.1 hypothetical protein ATE47_01060 [Chryseobacterium sp. IHB B 17019]MDR6406036.1 uncharacterized protein YhhL (DUF1145 family) [Chryseobacterium geocarposphaerae]MDR6699519.1 uncharacterized protein YhhL (DUF1145 family) [Chryseobacterium ginsenosidimutans]
MKKTLSTYFNKTFTPSFIVFLRVSIAFVLLVHFISIWNDFELLYSNKSIIPIEIHGTVYEYNIIAYSQIETFLSGYFQNPNLTFKYIYVVLTVFIMLGFFSRISAMFLLILQVSLVKSASLFMYGVDFFASMSLFYIFLFPTSSYFSVQKKFFPKTILNFPIQSLNISKRILQLHVCIAYFFSGLDKILGFNWWNGESVWKSLNLPNFTRFLHIPSFFDEKYSIMYIISGWAIICVELFYPIFININKTRKLWLTLTILMHIGIIISFNLFFFSLIMIIWNLTSYYFNYYEKDKIFSENSTAGTVYN